MTKKIKKLVWVSFQAFSGLIFLLCLLACLSPFVHAGKYPIIGLLGLVFPLLYLSSFVLTIYWAFKKSKWLWPGIVIMLAGLFQFTMVFGLGFSGKFKEEKGGGNIRIVSWNISSWGLTNRNNRNKASYRYEMTDLLNKTDADVICLQEYHFLREKTLRDTLIPELREKGYNYFFFARSKYTMRLYSSAHVTGVVIASKFPIADTGHFSYGDDDYAEPLIYTDIRFNNKMVRIFTTHLQSVRFEPYDYAALHNLKEPVNASVTQSRAVAWKLKQAFKKRALQAVLLHKKIEESPHPVILCGDFNDVPGSYAYYIARGNLQDAFLKTGLGFGRTYRFLSPTLRIDYIMADKKFTVAQYKKIVVPFSDHYPIMADIDTGN